MPGEKRTQVTLDVSTRSRCTTPSIDPSYANAITVPSSNPTAKWCGCFGLKSQQVASNAVLSLGVVPKSPGNCCGLCCASSRFDLKSQSRIDSSAPVVHMIGCCGCKAWSEQPPDVRTEHCIAKMPQPQEEGYQPVDRVCCMSVEHNLTHSLRRQRKCQQQILSVNDTKIRMSMCMVAQQTGMETDLRGSQSGARLELHDLVALQACTTPQNSTSTSNYPSQRRRHDHTLQPFLPSPLSRVRETEGKSDQQDRVIARPGNERDHEPKAMLMFLLASSSASCTSSAQPVSIATKKRTTTRERRQCYSSNWETCQHN